MEISIDLTELNSQEIIEALERYPYGHLENKSNRVFWLSRDNPSKEVYPSSPAIPPLRGANNPKVNQMEQANRAFKKMTDTLGSMIC